MSQVGNMHSLNFPAARKANGAFPSQAGTEPDPAVKRGKEPRLRRAAKTVEVQQPNVMETFANALRDVETIREKLRGLVNSGSRHGDLQVARSAAIRIQESLSILIDAEEQS